MTKLKVAKKSTKVPKTSGGKCVRGFVALHSTDATVFLSAGFLPPRATDPSEQTAHGTSIIVSASPVPASLLDRACGTRDFGFPVLVEVEIPNDGIGQLGRGMFIADSPIPIANALSLNFKTDEQLKEFHARAGSYGDVPISACVYKVDPALFGERDSAELFSFPEPNNDLATARLRLADKIGGSIATYLAAARGVSEAEALGWIQRAFATTGARLTLANVLGGLAAAMGGSDSGDVRLVEEAGNFLDSTDPGSGFRRQDFLSGLAGRAEATGDEKFAAFVNRFVKHAEDVAAARRELADDAFAETDGKIQLRALLLFMLNPDPDRLLLAPRRIKILGTRVFCLAAAVAGGFGGLARLPSSMKAPNRQAFSGLTLLVHQAISGREVMLERALAWDAKGVRQDVLTVAGNELARAEAAPPKVLSTAFGIASRVGLKPTFRTETGELEIKSDKYNFPITLRISKVPTVPLIDGLRAGAQLLSTGGVKRLGECVRAINESAQETGTFAKVFMVNQHRGIEVFATCAQDHLTDGAFGALVTAVGAAASTLRDQLQGGETASAGDPAAAKSLSSGPESGPRA